MRRVLTFLLLLLSVAAINSAAELDRFGGLKSKSFDLPNAGFFRTTFQDGQWWLVTPENHAFLSFGLNHFHSGLWTMELNREHWEQEFGGPVRSAAWNESFYEDAARIVSAMGANSMGYHNEEPILLERPPLKPHFRQFIPVRFSMHMRAGPADYVDIFDPAFRSICDKAAREQVAPYVDDPMIIGFAMADIPVMTERWAKAVSKGRPTPTWAVVLRNLPASSPGKQEYVRTLQGRHASIEHFNKRYGTDFVGWIDLMEAEDWRPLTDFDNETEIEDNNAFNARCIREYYATAEAAFRAVNPNHLFLGDKLNANLHPDDVDLTFDAVKDYVDVVLYQFYGRGEYREGMQNRIARVTNLPMINGDGGFGAFGDPRMPNPQSPQAKDQTQRAQWMYEYAENSFRHPNFVGWHICGVIDSWATESYGRQKAGLMNPLGVWHDEVFTALHQISEELYEFRE